MAQSQRSRPSFLSFFHFIIAYFFHFSIFSPMLFVLPCSLFLLCNCTCPVCWVLTQMLVLVQIRCSSLFCLFLFLPAFACFCLILLAAVHFPFCMFLQVLISPVSVFACSGLVFASSGSFMFDFVYLVYFSDNLILSRPPSPLCFSLPQVFTKTLGGMEDPPCL